MILVAFVGTPIANHLLGRTAYSLNTNAQGFEPALPWTHAPTAAGNCCTLYVLGTSDTAGHDELLRHDGGRADLVRGGDPGHDLRRRDGSR